MADSSSSAPGGTRRSWLQRFTSWVRPTAPAAPASAPTGQLAFRSPTGGSPYVGEIAIFAGNFPPAGWELCNGQLLSISDNDTLFQLIGTTYGGDGQQTFALPNLCGRAPLHQGQGPGITRSYPLGEVAGVEEVTLTTSQLPVHNHALIVSTAPGTTASPQGALPANGGNGSAQYTQDTGSLIKQPAQNMAAVGGSQPHNNMQPYLVVNYIISLYGAFPSPQ